MAIADHRSHRRPRSFERPFPYISRNRSEIGIAFRVRPPRGTLVRGGKLLEGNLILVRMTGPGPVHVAARLVLLVVFESRDGTGIQCGAGAAGIERRHSSD